jgi:transposase
MEQRRVLLLTETELITLDEMGRHHPYADFRFRARGLVSLNAGHKPEMIAQVLGISQQSVYNWAKWWRRYGLVGLLDGHKGGSPAKLTEELVDSAIEIAAAELLTLEGIKQRLQVRHLDAPDFSIDRLSAGLKERKFSFIKRCRLLLKKGDIIFRVPKVAEI